MGLIIQIFGINECVAIELSLALWEREIDDAIVG